MLPSKKLLGGQHYLSKCIMVRGGKMIKKKSIEKVGLDPNFIKREAQGIIKEISKSSISLNYIGEKANNILKFIETLENYIKVMK